MAIGRHLFFLSLLLFLSCTGTGCSGLLYHPDHREHAHPRDFGFADQRRWDDLWIEGLHAWRFRSGSVQSKGLVLFFHGNAQNLTSHFTALSWLPEHGFEYVIFDYRGYGKTPGAPTPETTVEDGVRMIRWALKQEKPLILFGQSLGGAVLQRALEETAEIRDPRELAKIKLVAFESSFTSYREAGRSVLASSWLTWPFQWIPDLVLSDAKAAEGALPPGPRYLIIHGTHDPVVSEALGRALYQRAPPKKSWWLVPGGGHIQAFWMFDPKGRYPFRENFVSLLNEVTGHPAPALLPATLMLPFPESVSFAVLQGPGGDFSHRNEQEHAIDFAMPEGTPVLAMRDGTVVRVVRDHSSGGPSEEFASQANLVLIEHEDGTFAEYVHLKQSSVMVRTGERVLAGALLGLSGFTGFASEPHLHVRHYSHLGSIPMVFEDGEGMSRTFETGDVANSKQKH